MISIRFISNTNEKLANNINQLFEWAEEIDIAVAYLKTGAFDFIKGLLSGKKVRILLGFDFCLTDVEPLRDILDKGYPCKVYRTPMTSDERSYHPKIYIAKKKNEIRAIIGSSNMTRGGLSSNIEGNILLSADKTESCISEILDFFEQKWRSSLAHDINIDLINEYAALQMEYKRHIERLHLKSSFVSKRDKISSKGNSVIVCMTKDHDRNDVYDRLVGVPIRAKKVAFENIRKNTRVFIYYLGSGISKAVEATDEPYIDFSIVNEWRDGFPETYPVRVRTQPLHHYVSSVKFDKLQDMDICRVDTGKRLVYLHLRSSVIPISDNDGDSIEKELSK
jgi:HKD family nuclease